MIKNGKNIICQNCGKSFYVPKYRLKKAKYCSKKCHGQAVLGNEENQSKIKHPTGKNHPNWKGGFFDKRGYKWISIKGKRFYEHRYIMEKYLGRKLKPNETIHHINRNKADNRLENLELISRSEHSSKYNNREKKQHKKKICEICKNPFFNDRNKRFCSNDCRNQWLSTYFITNNPNS